MRCRRGTTSAPGYAERRYARRNGARPRTTWAPTFSLCTWGRICGWCGRAATSGSWTRCRAITRAGAGRCADPRAPRDRHLEPAADPRGNRVTAPAIPGPPAVRPPRCSAGISRIRGPPAISRMPGTRRREPEAAASPGRWAAANWRWFLLVWLVALIVLAANDAGPDDLRHQARGRYQRGRVHRAAVAAVESARVVRHAPEPVHRLCDPDGAVLPGRAAAHCQSGWSSGCGSRCWWPPGSGE